MMTASLSDSGGCMECYSYIIYSHRKLYHVKICVEGSYVLISAVDRVGGDMVDYELTSDGEEYLLVPLLGWKVSLGVKNHFKDDYIEYVLDTIEEILNDGVVLEEKHETI